MLAFKPGDEKLIVRIENHPDPRSTLFYALPTTLEQQAEKIRNVLNDSKSILFIICRTEDDDPIAETALFCIDWIGRMPYFILELRIRGTGRKDMAQKNPH